MSSNCDNTLLQKTFTRIKIFFQSNVRYTQKPIISQFYVNVVYTLHPQHACLTQDYILTG